MSINSTSLDGNFKIIDLTYTLSETNPVYPGKTEFSKVVYNQNKNGFHVNDIQLSTGIGTHMDAPTHRHSDKNSIDAIPLTQLHATACLLHLTDQAGSDSEYKISIQDIVDWEKEYGKIPDHSIILVNTGWSKYWEKQKFCFQEGQKIMHGPSFSKEAAQMVMERKPKGVGIDTISIGDGPTHSVFLERNIFLVENLANLDKLPPTGAYVWILPMKIKDAPEAPVRAFALIQKTT